VSAVLQRRSQEAHEVVFRGISVLFLLLAVGVGLGEDVQALMGDCAMANEQGRGLLEEIQGFLNQKNDLVDFELYFELECQICAEEGFAECQGHIYSDETGYLS